MGRVNFQTIFNRYKRVGKANVRLTQSTLILSQPINANKTVYNFDVLETQTANLTPEQIRLNLNDEFIVATMGIYLQASLLSETGADTGVKKLLTYAPMELDQISMRQVQNLYNGQLSIAVNNIVYLEKWDTAKHELVPRTQYSNLVAAPGANATQPSNTYSKDSMFPVEPLITLSGAKKSTLQLSLASAIVPSTYTFTDDKGSVGSYKIDRIVWLMRGLNAQNGAVFQS